MATPPSLDRRLEEAREYGPPSLDPAVEKPVTVKELVVVWATTGAARRELLPRAPLLEIPRGYKPAMTSDWCTDRRRPYTLADAILTRPDLKLSTTLGLVRWALRNRWRGRRLARTTGLDSPAR